MVRTTYIDCFTEDEKMEIEVKMKFDATNGNYPILAIKTESKTIRFYSTMEQLKQLQQALNEFVGENTKKYLRCIKNDEDTKQWFDFTVGKDYLVRREDKGIYEIKDDMGDLRYINASVWDNIFTLIEK